MMNNIKKTPEGVHIFVVFFAIAGIWINLLIYLILAESLTITLLRSYSFVVL